jgi:hypothetical protein
MAGTRSASTFSQPHPLDTDETVVAAAEYASYDRVSSELSGPNSDVSCPSQGWASVAASERQEPAMEVMARLHCCHVCYGKENFLLYCTLLSTEVKHRIAVQRAQQIQQDRGVGTAGGGNPHSGPLIIRSSPTMPPLAPPLSPRARPTCPTKRGAHVRVTQVGVVPNRPQQS